MSSLRTCPRRKDSSAAPVARLPAGAERESAARRSPTRSTGPPTSGPSTGIRASLQRHSSTWSVTRSASSACAYAGALVERLSASPRRLRRPQRPADQLASAAIADITELPDEVNRTARACAAPITGGDAMVGRVVEACADKVRTQLYTRASAPAQRGPADVRPRRAASRCRRRSARRRRSWSRPAANQLRHDGLARLETTQYAAWPSDERPAGAGALRRGQQRGAADQFAAVRRAVPGRPADRDAAAEPAGGVAAAGGRRPGDRRTLDHHRRGAATAAG